jgi:hypothetical protein
MSKEKRKGKRKLISENSNSNTTNKLIEPFDGIKKYNARRIFGILLIFIIIDFGLDLVYD